MEAESNIPTELSRMDREVFQKKKKKVKIPTLLRAPRGCNWWRPMIPMSKMDIVGHLFLHGWHSNKLSECLYNYIISSIGEIFRMRINEMQSVNIGKHIEKYNLKMCKSCRLCRYVILVWGVPQNGLYFFILVHHVSSWCSQYDRKALTFLTLNYFSYLVTYTFTLPGKSPFDMKVRSRQRGFKKFYAEKLHSTWFIDSP